MLSGDTLSSPSPALSKNALVIKAPHPSMIAPVILGLTAILASWGGLIVWSLVATISSAVIVPGKIVVDGGTKLLQHPSGGVVVSIDVKEGQEVASGQTLIRLDPTVMDIDDESFKRLLAINMASQARLRAERDRLQTVSFEGLGGGISEKVWQQISSEQLHLFQARRVALMSGVRTLRSDCEEALSVASTISVELREQRLRIRLTEKELETASRMAEQGLGTRQRVLETGRALAEMQSDLANLNSRQMDARQSAEHDMLEAKQEDASFLQGVSAELQSAQKEEAELLLKIKTVEQQRAALQIRSPVSGRVVNLSVHTVGGVIVAGETLMEIVPSKDELAVEAEVRPEDVDGITIGSPVDIRLSGPQNESSPRLIGRVALVSADRITDLRHSQAFFRVRAEVSGSTSAENLAGKLRPGYAVTLMIRHGEHTPLNYLLAPLTDFFKRSLH